MSRLSIQVQYDKKIEELHQLLAKEAKKLQYVIDERESVLFEMKNLSRRKMALGKVIADLEKQTKEKKEVLNQLMERESSFVSSVKLELNKEKSSLEEIKKIKDKTKEELKGLNKVTSELNEFIKKEEDVRKKYLKERKELHLTQNENKKITIDTDSKIKELDRKNREMDVYKKYLTDLYGRIASYVKVAQESITSVNEFMEKNEVPLKFELPPGEVININIDNFNIKPVDT